MCKYYNSIYYLVQTDLSFRIKPQIEKNKTERSVFELIRKKKKTISYEK